MFAAERDREQLESAFRTRIERLGGAGADAQCPMPRDDKTEAVNAQFEAEEFNRKLGATLHAVRCRRFSSATIAPASPQGTGCYSEIRVTAGSLSPDHSNR